MASVLGVNGLERWLCPVHFTTEKFENTFLFLQSGLPSTLSSHDNGAFLKRFSNRSNLKTPGLRFNVDGKLRGNDRHVISVAEFSSNTNPEPYCVFKFPRCIVEGKHLICFQGENAVFKFLVDLAQGKYFLPIVVLRLPQNIKP